MRIFSVLLLISCLDSVCSRQEKTKSVLPDSFDLIVLLLQALLSFVTELSEFGGQALGPLFFSFAALQINVPSDISEKLSLKTQNTYSFSFLVCSSKFITLILKTAELNFQFVQTTGELSDLVASIVQVICKQIIFFALFLFLKKELYTKT